MDEEKEIKENKPQEKPVKKTEKKVDIPILRTYEHDLRSIKNLKSSSELQKLLVKEAEKKRLEKKEYVEKAKELLKESSKLQDSQNKFILRQEKRNKELSENEITENLVKQVDKEKISSSIAKATNQMNGFEKVDIGARTIAGDTNKNLEEKVETPRSKDEILQEETVEKNIIQKQWDAFERKKETLKEMGLNTRDARSYEIETKEPKKRNSENMIAILIIILLIFGIGLIIWGVLNSNTDKPAVQPINKNTTVLRDLILTDEEIYVDLTGGLSNWYKERGVKTKNDTVTKFVFYETINNNNQQLSLQTFVNLFGLNPPRILTDSLNNYYFAGRVKNNNSVGEVLIFSVRNYGNTLGGLIKWEDNFLSSFVNLSPEKIDVNDSTLNKTSVIIENKDVKIIEGSNERIAYYFFNNETLIILIGDIDLIEYINNRIRNANI